MRNLLISIAFLLAACGGKDDSPPADVPAIHDQGGSDIADGHLVDLAPVPDVVPEVGEVLDLRAADAGTDLVPDLVRVDETVDSFEVVEPACLEPPPDGEYTGTDLALEFHDQGVNQWEMAAFETLADAALTSASIYFVSTYLAEEGLYQVRHKGGHFSFKRTFGPTGPEFEVVEMVGDDPFACKELDGFNTYEKELAAYENPAGTSYVDKGYTEDDPRVGFIEADKHCYPLPMLRIAQLYDAPNAPDFHYSYTPWGVGSGGSHGALDILQSRAPLVVSGPGIKKGTDGSETPLQVDIAPTVLYLMGAQPEPGLKHGLDFDSTYVKWQDGRPLTAMLEEECTQPFKYVFILLFDGLEANELVHLYESGEVALPALSNIMDDGTIFTNGTVVAFPSVSIPGHLSVGTGMLNGHHFFSNNGFYYREEQLVVSPGAVMAMQDEYIENPEKAVEMFEFVFNPLGETIFQAAHRHFGDDVLAASVNEPTLMGADHSIVDMARALKDFRADYYELADTLAIPQVTGLIDEHLESGKRMLFLISFYTTDGAGEGYGPHSDVLREKLATLDTYVGKLLERVEDKGMRDQSLFVITADHGMELQDSSRSDNWKAPMQATGLKFVDPDGFGMMYIPTLRVECATFEGQGTWEYTVTVISDDTLEPVEGALVSLSKPECGAAEICSAATDESGVVVLQADSGEPNWAVAVSHPDYNPASANCF